MRPSFIRIIMLAAASAFGGHAIEVLKDRRPKPISEPLVPEGPGHNRSAPFHGRSHRRGWRRHLAPSRAWHVGRARSL